MLQGEEREQAREQRDAGDPVRAKRPIDPDGVDNRKCRVQRHQVPVRLRVDIRAADDEHDRRRNQKDVEDWRERRLFCLSHSDVRGDERGADDERGPCGHCQPFGGRALEAEDDRQRDADERGHRRP